MFPQLYLYKQIKFCIPELIEKIKYTQNKYIWMKAAMGILTTDLKPKVAMEECKIGKTNVKIYGIAKGSGMIFPNMATTLGFIFTDANLSSSILKILFLFSTDLICPIQINAKSSLEKFPSILLSFPITL